VYDIDIYPESIVDLYGANGKSRGLRCEIDQQVRDLVLKHYRPDCLQKRR